MLQFNFYSAIEQIGQQQWNTLCGTQYPFIRYEFLHCLEQSGSVSAITGWQPCHLLITDNDLPIAAMPLYLKNHSYGEYVFDWAWADAYQRHGLDYYPKLLTAIPFTPCYGPRLCFSNSLNQTRIQQITKQVISTLQEFAQQHNASGWHTLFIENHQFINTENQTLIKRLGCQYHWFNRDYHSFEDFLAGFSSRKRKNLKKERTKILNQNIEHRFVKGPELSDELLESFYRFYQITYLKRGRQGYLKKNFFHLLRDLLPEQLLICFAFDTGFSKDEPVAGALFMQGEDTLYGRYWGALEEYDSLHFETCYYQGIEYCIANQLSRFDPGAQGEHKIQRGFEPIETWSTHWLARPEFRSAVQRFTEEEEQMVRQDINFLKQRLPFKKPS